MEQGAGKVRDNQTAEKEKFGIDAQDGRPEIEKMPEKASGKESIKPRKTRNTRKEYITEKKLDKIVSHGNAEKSKGKQNTVNVNACNGQPSFSTVDCIF